MPTKNETSRKNKIRRKALVWMLSSLVLLALACVRSTPSSLAVDSAATEASAQTADAGIEMTLQALLGSATVENLPSDTAAIPTDSGPSETPTLESLQLTQLAAALTGTAASPTATKESTSAPSKTPNSTTAPCYAARYVYDETYPDGTRVDPGQSMQKTWRLQNVGTCDWKGGEYELVFLGGDRMSGATPLTINITVLAGAYANFTINFVAPGVPGTYHGDWMLRTKAGDAFGVGPSSDLPFWIEIIVRGATPTP